jgi:energy-converting hydrogenase B subunit D
VTGVLTAIDVLLASSLVLLAWRILAAPDLFRSVVLFITFGVLMAVCWVRLRAPDLALVEVAIGAGLTGALFLHTLGYLEGDDPVSSDGEGER